MAKINLCFKRIFVFFNSLFAIFGLFIIALALYVHMSDYVQEVQNLYGIVSCYVIGSLMFIISLLAAYGAYKESKCALIVFFVLMSLAAIAMLRAGIPLANSQKEIISATREYFQWQMPKETLKPIQENLHCCGLFDGYNDWSGDVPESCNCVDKYARSDTCVNTFQRNRYLSERNSNSRKVWSKSCGPILMDYAEKLITITLAVLFTLAALAILGSLMSLMMIVRINKPDHSHMAPSLALSYQPPKYSEVVKF